MAAPFPTREDFFQVGARELLARAATRPAGKRVTATAVYTVGTNVNSALAGAAAMADEVMRHAAIRYGELFLDSAEGDALERVITDHVSTDIVRRQPSPSVVPVTISRSSSPESANAYTASAGTIVRTDGGIEFRTLSDVTFAANTLGSTTVDAQCQLAGTAGNVDSGTILQFAQQPIDTGVTVANYEPATGGMDLESDRDYLARAKLERTARRMGLADTLRLTALSQPGVKSVSVTELTDSSGDPSGPVEIYISDVNGRANSTMVRMVRDALYAVRVCGIPVYVFGSTPLNATISYSVGYAPNTDTAVAASRLRSLTASMVNELAAGETLQRSMLFAIARTIPGLIVTDSSVLLPTTDLTPSASQSVKTQVALILVNGA